MSQTAEKQVVDSSAFSSHFLVNAFNKMDMVSIGVGIWNKMRKKRWGDLLRLDFWTLCNLWPSLIDSWKKKGSNSTSKTALSIIDYWVHKVLAFSSLDLNYKRLRSRLLKIMVMAMQSWYHESLVILESNVMHRKA